MEDWLQLPGEEQSLPEKEQPVAEKNPDLPAPLPAKLPPEQALLAQKRGSFATLLQSLKPMQRLYLRQLVKSDFNSSRAIRACKVHGHKIARQTALRWKKTDPTYATVFEMIEEAAVGESTRPATMLLQADEILQLAMRGTKRFDKEGRFTGRERQLDTALRANEQKMKATGMLRGDDKTTRVTVRLVNLAGLDGQKVIDGQAVEVQTE